MKEKLSHNLKLKIVAVLIAAGLWMISININDPYQSNDYSVIVQLQNMNIMTAAGKFVEVVGNTDEISVRVRGNRSVMEAFTVSNIVATADIKEMDENNRIPIRLSTVKTVGNKIESLRANEEYLTVKIENILRVQKNIEIETKNEPAEGYLLGGTHTEQNALNISGPESIVKNLEKAVVSVDLAGAKDDVSMLLPIELYDKEGRRIIDNRLTSSINEVQCVASILATKEVPVVLVAKGTEARGYGFNGQVLLDPEKIVLAGKNNVLRNLREIRVEDALDLTAAKANVSTKIDIKEYLPDNVILADPEFNGQINGTAIIEKEVMTEYFYDGEDIVIENLPKEYKAEIELKENILLLSLFSFGSKIETASLEQVRITVDMGLYMEEKDLTKLEEKTYVVPGIVQLPEGIWMETEVKIPVKITEISNQ
ncbi:MAG: hypothetical protein IKL51_04815 [Lachnospiraceae bacterium]|nr:hypothetical protein [Lachnospiraceae bacterium]